MNRGHKLRQEMRARKRLARKTVAARARKGAEEMKSGYFMKMDCGCCEEQCHMSKEEAARVEAWMRAHPGNGMTVTYTDEKGQNHSVQGVDTFYGLRPASEGDSPRGLAFLFDRAVGRRL